MLAILIWFPFRKYVLGKKLYIKDCNLEPCKKIEIPSLLTVFLSIPFNKLPCVSAIPEEYYLEDYLYDNYYDHDYDYSGPNPGKIFFSLRGYRI